MAILDVPALLPHIRSGKLRALGVARVHGTRCELPACDVCTARTPREVVARLNTEVRNALNMPDIAERLTTLGVEPVGNSPDELADFLRQEIAHWGKVVRQSWAKSE